MEAEPTTTYPSDLPARVLAYVPTQDDAIKVVEGVTRTVLAMSAGAEQAPVFSIIDVARNAGLHPIMVAAVIRYNPGVRELYQLLSDTVTSELMSRYLTFIMSDPTEAGQIDLAGRLVPALSKDQIDACKFYLQNQVQLSPSTGLNTETELSRILGFRSDKDAELDPATMSTQEKVGFLRSAIKSLKDSTAAKKKELGIG